jgi:hypothetical protein
MEDGEALAIAVWKEGIERREKEDLTCGPKDILELSHNLSLLFNRKLLI